MFYLNSIFTLQPSASLSHNNTAMLRFVGLHLIQLTKQFIHMFQANTLCLWPKEDDYEQPNDVNTHQNPIRIISDIIEHDGPSLVNPECCQLLASLGDVDAFVTDFVREDLAGVDPGAGTKGSGVGLQIVSHGKAWWGLHKTGGWKERRTYHFNYEDKNNLDDGTALVEVRRRGKSVCQSADYYVTYDLEYVSTSLRTCGRNYYNDGKPGDHSDSSAPFVNAGGRDESCSECMLVKHMRNVYNDMLHLRQAKKARDNIQ